MTPALAQLLLLVAATALMMTVAFIAVRDAINPVQE